mmetsp:Transcript_97206/g.208500  ORF Transcript_97206/g.208500 Transcript_97206/m.208500 type:complete len:306 (+) Transcript_97206:952-1869(+)
MRQLVRTVASGRGSCLVGAVRRPLILNGDRAVNLSLRPLQVGLQPQLLRLDDRAIHGQGQIQLHLTHEILRTRRHDCITLRFRRAIVVPDLEQHRLGDPAGLDLLHCIGNVEHLPPQVLRVTDFLLGELIPDLCKCASDDADWQRKDHQAPDHTHHGDSLSRGRGGVIVAIAHCCGRHQGPPEGVRDGSEGCSTGVSIKHFHSAVQDRVVHDVNRALIEPQSRVPGPLLAQVHEGPEDHDAYEKIESENVECLCRLLHRSPDDDHGLDVFAEPHSACDPGEAEEPEHHQAVPLVFVAGRRHVDNP